MPCARSALCAPGILCGAAHGAQIQLQKMCNRIRSVKNDPNLYAVYLLFSVQMMIYSQPHAMSQMTNTISLAAATHVRIKHTVFGGIFQFVSSFEEN